MRKLIIAAALVAVGAVTASAAPTANTCVASKIDCAGKRAAAVLKCYAKAQKKGAVVDGDCLTKAQDKFDDCFAKAESKQDVGKPATVCRTEGDAAAMLAAIDALVGESACAADPAGCPSGDCEHSPCATGAALSECNACVARICETETLDSCCTTAWDARCVAAVEPLCGVSCTSYSQPPSSCSGGKTSCTAKRLRAVLSCFKTAQKKGTELDAECIAQAAAKFDGGADPAKGCFEKLEAKQDPAKPASLCAITDDTAQAEAYTDYAADRLACELDGDHCPCCEGQCYEPGTAVAPPSDHAATDLVCGEATRGRTNFMPPCETCGGCPVDEACMNGECEYLAGERRCQAARPVPNCLPSLCSYMQPAQTEPGTGAGTRGDYRYTFVDVEGYQDRAVYVPMNFDSIAEHPTYIPQFYSCEGNGSFMTARSNNLGCIQSQGAPCWDRDGRIFDRAAADTILSYNMTPQCTGLFYDGPLTSLVSSQFMGDERYIFKFTPDPGWTGTARVAVVVQPATTATYVPVVEYNIHIRPGAPPYEQDRNIITRPETGHVYELITTRETWADALGAAAAMNYEGRQGHLLTISDAAENEFVISHFAGNLQPLLIALGDPISEGAYQWFGVLEPLAYTNWNAGEPNNSGEEDVVVMTTGYGTDAGKWNDVAAASTFRYVVEYE